MKKKIVITSVLVALFLSLTGLTASAAVFYSYEKIVDLKIGAREASVNGKMNQMDEAAYIKDGRTLVPLRFLGEALGASVDWEGKTHTATVKLKDKLVQVTVGSKTAYINRTKSVLDVPAEIKNGRTFVPFRFVSEAFGAAVSYDDKTKNAAIVLVDTSGWKLLHDNLSCPPDWNGELTDNGMLHYVSPQNSEVWIQNSNENSDVVMAKFKKGAIDSGYTFVKDEDLFPGINDLGKKMLFLEYDADGKPYAEYEITVEQTEADIVITQIYIPLEAAAPDMPVINTIVNQ